MQFRHELKNRLNYMDYLILRQRLRAMLPVDSHVSGDGSYHIRSLYFDNADNKALREKLDGVCEREKFRIRCYNGDDSLIRLEKKYKYDNLGCKFSARLTRAQVQSILDGETGWMGVSEDPLIRELYYKMLVQGLRPRTIVDYVREPFTFPAGNVRVTLDRDIRTGISATDFFNTELTTVPTGENAILMEVKYDDFIPTIVLDAIQTGERRSAAFSKYAACRVYDC